MKMVYLIIFLNSIIGTHAYTQDSINNKYLLSLIYLKTDYQINQQIKNVFPELVKKKDKVIEFKLRDEIWFLNIHLFQRQLNKQNYGLDSAIINNWRFFEKEYYFKPFRVESLKKIIRPSDSKIILTFSKPFGNYLLAEMLDSRLLSSEARKFGKSMMFLFIFNSEGLIENVLHSSTHYN